MERLLRACGLNVWVQRLTYEVDGGTATHSFATPATQRKARREIAGFARYGKLSQAQADGHDGSESGGDSLPRCSASCRRPRLLLSK
ncbi:MAG: hypothetical protein IT160_04090 [Bryobacterales bacterium]|nr:hypothetical protein [Bryobacterales bacterium]